ncbi:hypothetical protein BDV96DRAFT_639943 [Lophiotrema nucula]|uniref:Hpc2-related domain-containing protein n=1 Tax=Lophiotrema nucula TaxID=690887 RepID=A0A6A5ZQ97_9PLEO|nr:hypothetical protein BDV96DRAFT_639943 [Lophiotrema nucula]
MEVIDVPSSPGSLSSPPHSPPEQGNSSTIAVNSGVSPAPAASTQTTPRLTASGQPRKKPGPKPKPKDPSAAVEKKPRKPRKTAEPKDSIAEPAPRKRRTKASLEAQSSTPQPAPPPVDETPIMQQPTPTPQSRPAELVQVVHSEPPPIVSQAPRVLSNPEPIQNNPSLSHISVAPSTPRPASSGQRYDPIRGGLYESKPANTASAPPISPPLNRASASPSITSLIDPPSAANSTYPQAARLQQQQSVTSAPVSPAASSRPPSILPQQEVPQPLRPSAPLGPTPMEIDSDANSRMSIPMKKSDSASAGTPSNAPTPPVKPVRQKEAPPPLPTGSGLLSGTPFGPAVGTTNGSTDPQGVNIWLTFPLKGQTNVTINFAQEVEKKYGFAALHPRIAARRERTRQITAAGAALEKAAGAGSADDMSLDLSEAESNVEMGGMDDEASGKDGAVKRRRKRKQEDYDKEDDFIDDTELAWEQQALMAKDGFFVYSGPLLTEGEKPASRWNREARARTRTRWHRTRRDFCTVRKPRVTKADRAMMEQEKHEREKMAATIAAKQPMPTYAAGTPV